MESKKLSLKNYLKNKKIFQNCQSFSFTVIIQIFSNNWCQIIFGLIATFVCIVFKYQVLWRHIIKCKFIFTKFLFFFLFMQLYSGLCHITQCAKDCGPHKRTQLAHSFARRCLLAYVHAGIHTSPSCFFNICALMLI